PRSTSPPGAATWGWNTGVRKTKAGRASGYASGKYSANLSTAPRNGPWRTKHTPCHSAPAPGRVGAARARENARAPESVFCEGTTYIPLGALCDRCLLRRAVSAPRRAAPPPPHAHALLDQEVSLAKIRRRRGRRRRHRR